MSVGYGTPYIIASRAYTTLLRVQRSSRVRCEPIHRNEWTTLQTGRSRLEPFCEAPRSDMAKGITTRVLTLRRDEGVGLIAPPHVAVRRQIHRPAGCSGTVSRMFGTTTPPRSPTVNAP